MSVFERHFVGSLFLQIVRFRRFDTDHQSIASGMQTLFDLVLVLDKSIVSGS